MLTCRAGKSEEQRKREKGRRRGLLARGDPFEGKNAARSEKFCGTRKKR